MRKNSAFAALCVLALLPCAHAPLHAAEEEAPPAIDARGRPESIPVSSFVSSLALGSAVLSRGGKRLAIREDVDGKVLVRVFDAETRALQRVIDGGPIEDFNWFRWAGDDRLLLSLMRNDENALFWARSSKLLVYDLRTAALSYVGLKGQGLEGDDILYTDPGGEYILLSLSEKGRTPPKVWHMPLDGTASEAAVLVQDKDGDIEEWWADSAGVVRLGMGRTQRGAIKIYYRSGPGEEFQRVTKLDADDKTFDNWDAMGLRPGTDVAYAVTSLEDGKRVLREVDLRSGEPGKITFEDPRWDVTGVLLDPNNKPIGVSIVADEAENIWFDPVIGNAQKDVAKALGSRAKVISASSDKGRMLVLQEASDDPGALYIYTPGKSRLDFFANLRPQLDYRVLAKTSAHDVTTRDGKTMRTFLTLPRGRPGKDLPMVVLPHGGPYGVRDQIGFSDWVQLFANRGYAVLQANFRGSGGYGKAWEDAGAGEIGRKMQDDLDDATAWAVAEGYADPARVCAVGASYGGYAAMWAIIRNPETYRCAISWAGVTDWGAQLMYDRDYLGRKFYSDKWKKQIRGDTPSFSLDDFSPHNQIKRLARPLLLAAGKQDKRVPFAQARRMAEVAKTQKKPVETLVLDDGHTPTEDENEKKLLQAMVDFLARHNPAD